MIMIILIIAATITTLLVALRAYMSALGRVLKELAALPDLTDGDRAAAEACFRAAKAADNKTWLYDLSAPIVMLLVLPFVKREADRLPKAFAKWDNNVSLNGDGEVVLRDGQWVNLRDIGWMPQHGERVYTYDDPAYTGDAYYAKGHHPRSWWARWVWVGWRNRASQLSVDLGRDVAARPLCISGNPDIHRNGPYGHFLLKSGNCYHYKSINRWHGLALIRSYGYKLEIVRNSQDGTGLAAAVAIGRSLKRRKA